MSVSYNRLRNQILSWLNWISGVEFRILSWRNWKRQTAKTPTRDLLESGLPPNTWWPNSHQKRWIRRISARFDFNYVSVPQRWVATRHCDSLIFYITDAKVLIGHVRRLGSGQISSAVWGRSWPKHEERRRQSGVYQREIKPWCVVVVPRKAIHRRLSIQRVFFSSLNKTIRYVVDEANDVTHSIMYQTKHVTFSLC